MNLDAGTVVSITAAGGGGFGPASDRALAAIERDELGGYV
jgi:N-methylhydantoinase B/oxoprolinase/acetone carboxylase alpha subunit